MIRALRKLRVAGRVFGLSVLALAFLAVPGVAKDKKDEPRAKPKPQTRRVESSGKWAFKRLQIAQDALAEGKMNEALAEMQGRLEKLSPNEKAIMWQTYGYAYSQQERYAQAAEAFEKCIATEGLPEPAILNTRFNLAQLYLVQEKYKKAIEQFEIWFAAAENPSPDAHYMLAAAYTQAEMISKALPHAKNAVAKSPEPKESWLQLLLSLHFQLKQYRDATGVLRKLIDRFPRKTYWMQLAAAYSELDDRKNALATMELAYEQDFLVAESEIMNLVQLYLFNLVPYEAAELLERELASGKVSSTSKNWELLANAWLHARERKKALQPLERAAELYDDGNLYARLGQVYVAEEDWANARRALAAALRKGKLRNTGNIHLMLGIANASDSRWEEARKAFVAAEKFEKSRKVAAEWITHVDEELTLKEYEKELEEAQEAADAAADETADET
jgi:tetratricopeptide (TPR) repeat protein